MGNFSENLRQLRGDRTQSEIAEALGIPTTTYASYEQGKRIPKDRMKSVIADFFDTTVAAIFFTN